MQIKLWGVRGSIPTPIHTFEYRQRLVHALEAGRERWAADPSLSSKTIVDELPDITGHLIGGETTCVEVLSGDGKDQLILDLGTGARRLGYDMMARGIKGDVYILLTHTYWDHIQGWPFFFFFFLPTNHIHFYSSFENARERFQRQQDPAHFPVEFEQMLSKREFHMLEPGRPTSINGFTVRTARLAHDGASLAYRLERDGKAFGFATDTEYSHENFQERVNSDREIFEGLDLLVMDARGASDPASAAAGRPQTSVALAIACAREWNVEHLVLVDHDPRGSDGELLVLPARSDADSSSGGPRVEVGREGAEFSL